MWHNQRSGVKRKSSSNGFACAPQVPQQSIRYPFSVKRRRLRYDDSEAGLNQCSRTKLREPQHSLKLSYPDAEAVSPTMVMGRADESVTAGSRSGKPASMGWGFGLGANQVRAAKTTALVPKPLPYQGASQALRLVIAPPCPVPSTSLVAPSLIRYRGKAGPLPVYTYKSEGTRVWGDSPDRVASTTTTPASSVIIEEIDDDEAAERIDAAAHLLPFVSNSAGGGASIELLPDSDDIVDDDGDICM